MLEVRLSVLRRFVSVMAACAALTSLAQAQSVQPVFRFTPAGTTTDGASPVMVVEHPSGLLYGVTAAGGTFSSGTLFSASLTGTVTTLHMFAGGAGDGAEPDELLVGADSNLYVTTTRGGANGCGAILSSSPSGVTALLYSWECSARGRIVHAAGGRVYFFTSSGGALGGGSFSFLTVGSGVTDLYDFPVSGCTAPSVRTRVVNGEFYGAGSGCVFGLSLAGSLHVVDNDLSRYDEVSALLLGRDGFLYIARWQTTCLVFYYCNWPSVLIRAARDGSSVATVFSGGGIFDWLAQAPDGSLISQWRTYSRTCMQGPCTVTYGGPMLVRFTNSTTVDGQSLAVTPTSAFITAANGLLYGFGHEGDPATPALYALAPVEFPPNVESGGEVTTPDALVAGVPTTWTAARTLLGPNPQYRFWVLSDIGWRIVQDYSPDPVLRWTPARSGQYAVQVWTRAADSPAEWDGFQGTGGFMVAPAPVLTVNKVAAVPQLPPTTGVQTTFAAEAAGGVGPLQYQFYLLEPGSGWRVLQSWSTAASVAWTPLVAGTYVLQVWVRSANSNAAYDAWRGIGPFVVAPGPLSLASIDADRPLPVGAGTTVTWMATPAGGSGAPLEYAFYRYNQGAAAWTLVRPYSPSPQWSWTPVVHDAGTYWLQVWARRQGVTAPYDAWRATSPFTVTTGPLAVSLSSSLSNASAVPALTPITWRWSATGASGPVEYMVWRLNRRTATWSVLQAYGSGTSITWTPTLNDAGLWSLQVWARIVGSTQAYEAWVGTGDLLVEP